MGCLGFNRVIHQFKNRFNILTSEQDRQNEDRWEQIHHSYELSIEVANCSFITIPVHAMTDGLKEGIMCHVAIKDKCGSMRQRDLDVIGGR